MIFTDSYQHKNTPHRGNHYGIRLVPVLLSSAGQTGPHSTQVVAWARQLSYKCHTPHLKV